MVVNCPFLSVPGTGERADGYRYSSYTNSGLQSLQGIMSFWRNFGFYTVSSIETTLNKPDFTLEDLLDDEEILQEVKAQNRKLIDVYVF